MFSWTRNFFKIKIRDFYAQLLGVTDCRCWCANEDSDLFNAIYFFPDLDLWFFQAADVAGSKCESDYLIVVEQSDKGSAQWTAV